MKSEGNTGNLLPKSGKIELKSMKLVIKNLIFDDSFQISSRITTTISLYFFHSGKTDGESRKSQENAGNFEIILEWQGCSSSSRNSRGCSDEGL